MNPDIRWGVVDVLIKVTIVLIAGIAIAAAMRRAQAACRHFVWLITCAAAMVTPLLCATLPGWRILPTWHEQHHPSSPEAKADTSPPFLETGSVLRPSNTPEARPIDVASPAVPAPKSTAVISNPILTNPPAMPPSIQRLQRPAFLLCLVWSIGCLLLLLQIAASWLVLRRIKSRSPTLSAGPLAELFAASRTKLNLRRRVALHTSRDHTMPMTWGIVRPVVLLPAAARDWPEDRSRLAMLHELAHVKRWDALWQLIGQFAVAFYWFHPLIWLAASGLKREQERAADDRVLSLDSSAPDYASLLVDLAGRPGKNWAGRNAAIAMARPAAIEERIRAILETGRNKGILSRSAALTGLALSIAMIVPVAALRGQSRPNGASTPASQPVDAANPPDKNAIGNPRERAEGDAVTPVDGDDARQKEFRTRARDKNIQLVFLGDSLIESWRTTGKKIWNQYYDEFDAANFGVQGERTETLLGRLDHGLLDGLDPGVVVIMIGANNVSDFPTERPEWTAAGVKSIVQKVHAKLPGSRVLLLGAFPRGGIHSGLRRRTEDLNDIIASFDDGPTEAAVTAAKRDLWRNQFEQKVIFIDGQPLNDIQVKSDFDAAAALLKEKMQLKAGGKTLYLDLSPNFLDHSVPGDNIMPDQEHLNENGYRIWAEAMKPVLLQLMKQAGVN